MRYLIFIEIINALKLLMYMFNVFIEIINYNTKFYPLISQNDYLFSNPINVFIRIIHLRS